MFYTDHTKEIAQCKRDIAKITTKLTKKCKRMGLYENFGQNEVRDLRDAYFHYVYECKEIRDLLNSFNDWAMNYTGR